MRMNSEFQCMSGKPNRRFSVVTYRDGACIQHGHFRSPVFMLGGKEYPPVCPGCVSALAADSVAAARSAASRRETEAILPSKRIDVLFANYAAFGVDQAHALDVAQDYVRNFGHFSRIGKSLFLIGSEETGIDYLAECVAAGVRNQDRTVVLCNMENFAAVRQGKSPIKQILSQMIDAMSAADLLIVERLDATVVLTEDWKLLANVIEDRCINGRSMIIASHVGLRDVTRLLGSYVMQCLRDAGSQVVLINKKASRSEL